MPNKLGNFFQNHRSAFPIKNGVFFCYLSTSSTFFIYSQIARRTTDDTEFPDCSAIFLIFSNIVGVNVICIFGFNIKKTSVNLDFLIILWRLLFVNHLDV